MNDSKSIEILDLTFSFYEQKVYLSAALVAVSGFLITQAAPQETRQR
jgi:hypothetical protein